MPAGGVWTLMKACRLLIAACWLATVLAPLRLQAEDKDGLRVSVTKTVLDSESQRFGPRQRHEVTVKETALKVRIQNLRPEELTGAKLDYVLQLKLGTPPLESGDRRRTGTETIAPLKANAATEFTLGAVRLHSANFRSEEDAIVGWQVVISAADGRKTTFQSPGYHEEKK